MVLGCLLAFAIAMLKRRASKRFVLAESGQNDVWDSTVDNYPNAESNPDNNMNNENQSASTSNTTSNNLLTVPKPKGTEGTGLK